MQSKHNGAHKWPRVEVGLQWGTWMRMCAGRGGGQNAVLLLLLLFSFLPLLLLTVTRGAVTKSSREWGGGVGGLI